MREKYESLPLTTLKDIARDRGIKHLSAMKKADVVEALLATDPTPEAVSDTGSNTAPEVYSPSTDEKNVSKNSAAETDATENDAAPRYTVKSNIREYNRENRTSGMQRSSAPGGRQQQMGRKTYVQNTGSNYNTRSTTQNASNGYNARPTASKPVIRQYRGEDIIDPEADAREQAEEEKKISLESLDSGEMAEGILEVMPEGFGFIRSANYLPGDNDVYVAPSQIRRFNMKTGDIVKGTKRIKASTEKFAALLFVNEINGFPTRAAEKRPNFEDLTPVFPDSRLHLEVPGGKVSMRIMDLLCPIGKGQRGMIVSPPKAGKTTLLKQVAQSIKINHPSIHLIILLIDERPEEVTDIKESIEGPNAEVIYSTFDELPEHHKRVSEMVLERAKRLVEHGMDVVILLDSITRLARAYNLTVAPSGRTLSGGLDPAALHMPKRFFGAARNMREGGSLTILATALVETGSRMDDVVFEEFKGTGNMELVLNRKLSEKRIFPAVDILKSSTRRDDLLLTAEEQEAVENIRRATSGMKADEAVERILDMFARTRNNQEFISMAKKTRFI
jgi:transcription termination factor Rho